MLVLKFLLAMLPIIWLMIALSVLKMPGFKACGIAAVIAAVLAAAYWRIPAAWTGRRPWRAFLMPCGPSAW